MRWQAMKQSIKSVALGVRKQAVTEAETPPTGALIT
jgi:hypothetical protein